MILLKELLEAIKFLPPPIPPVEWEHRTSPWVHADRVFVLRVGHRFATTSAPYLIVSREPLTQDLQMMAMAKYFEEIDAQHKG